MTSWVCRWKPFWVPRGDTFQKAYLEEWEQEDDDQSYIPGEQSKNNHRSRSVIRTTASESLQTVKDDGWSARRELPAPRGCPSLPQSSWQPFGDTKVPTKLWKHTETRERAVFCEPWGVPVPSTTRVRNFFHPKQFGIFPKRLSLPYPDEEILSGYEEDVSSIRDGFSPWVKADPETILKRHLVDAKGANPAFREAPARKHSPSNEEYRFHTEQKRLSIYDWNPGPRRGNEGAIEKHSAGTWHIITLQEAFEYLDHEYLTNRFCVTHYRGCAILFNKDTFQSDIKVSSVCLHDTRDGQQQDVKEGESGWVRQGCHIKGIVSAAATQRQSVLHGGVFTHQQPICQEARYRKEVTPHNPRCDARGACGLSSWRLQRCRLAAHAATIENPPISLKKPSPIRTC